MVDYTGTEGDHGKTGPYCAVDERHGNKDVRWNAEGKVDSGWGGDERGWLAVCRMPGISGSSDGGSFSRGPVATLDYVCLIFSSFPSYRFFSFSSSLEFFIVHIVIFSPSFSIV